ncbi:protein Shroom2 isoform X2 [Pleurodeles waltl]|uniref:protein Shroom2 isoform X2 n=1 Tax=Pleurodeles waltl TaxID=8319 RepID=UPI0037098459
MENMETRGSQERFLPDRGPRVSHGYVEQGPLVMVVEHRAADGWRLVEMLLSGGAPWGFTLKGGREHGEPLIITKIEDASKAAGKLLAGDEIISINDVELSGMRQEAICLVKGSHKTLKMIVKRRMKVVLELVAQKMPSESDLHLARSFLSKILRNSMRRNDAAGRPHSWHSTKFTENQSGATLSQLPSTNACSSWHSRYSSSSNQDLSASWDQASLQRTSDHFSSQGSMDSLEHPSQSYQYGRLSSAKSNNSIDHLGNQSKRDSAYGSFSTSSSTPDPMLCKPDAALTETMLYNENLWDPPKYAGNKEGQFLNEGSGTQDRLGYMPPPIQYENSRSPRGDDHSEARISNSGRSNFGPVWYVPEKKKAPSSPPPPPPPIRSDSFAVTKVHEKTNSSSYAEGTSTQHFTHINRPRGGELKSEASDYPQRLGRVNDHGAADVRKNINSTCRYEVNSDHGPATPGDKYNNNILNTNRLQSSLSSTDVRVAQPPLNYHHQRQYSDESTFFHNVRLSGSPKHQPLQHNNVYTNVKEQTTDHLFYNPQVRKPSPSISANIAAEQKMENAGQNRYYSVTTKQTPQGPSQSSQLKNESRKTGANAAQTTVLHNNSDTLAFVEKPKYPLPQQHDNASVESHGTNSLNRAEGYSGISAAGEHFQIPSCTERLDHRKGCEGMVKEIHNNHPCSQQENVKFSVSPADHGAPPHTDLGWGIEENKISPQKTPMLHSLSQENKTRSDSCPETVGDSDTIIDSLLLKQTRRNDRFATTLRNEIQMRRARLQKSKSTAALTESSESEEYPENWKPELPQNVVAPCDKTFTGSYKDHLKEAQARVLQATSFKRRDLEPLPLDHFPASSEFRGQSHSFSVSVLTPEDTPTEMKQNQGGIGSQQVSRIGGRKRFTAEQKLRSYSEPEKMNEVGVSVVHRHHHSRDRSNPSQEALGSFADRWKFFEETSKPAQNKPPQKPTLTSQLEEQPEVPPRKASLHEGERLWHDKRARAASLGFESVLDAHERPNNKISSDKQDFIRKTRNPEQPERLGTFAEYQASWKEQRKPLERRNSGRYHSADNILDVGLEQVEKQPYIHERSRSSPTTDFYAQGSSIDSRGQSDAPRESKEHASGESGSPDAGSASAVSHINTGQQGSSLEKKLLAVNQNARQKRRLSNRSAHSRENTGVSQENRGRSGTLPSDYRYSPDSLSQESNTTSSFHTTDPHTEIENYSQPQSRDEDSQQADSTVLNKKRGPAPQRPPPPKFDSNNKYIRQSGSSSSLATSSESLLTVPRKTSPSYSTLAVDVGVSHSPHTQSPSSYPEIPMSSQAHLQEPRHISPLKNDHLSIVKTHHKSESAPSSKHRYLQKPRMETSRSPSPQFAPQKLTDKPPVPVQDENPTRLERVINNVSVKKVPIKIVHSESNAEKESRHNLLSAIEPPALPPRLEKDQIKTLSTSEQSYSRFCAYTRQDPEAEVHRQLRIIDSEQGDVSRNNFKDSSVSSSAMTYVMTKEKTLEDIKTEELAREIVVRDKSLADILDPNVKMRTTMDLMMGIFPKDDNLLEEAQQRRKFLPKVPSPKPAEDKKDEQGVTSAISLTTSSAYYSTSAPKAELLIKMKDMQQQQLQDQQQQPQEDSEEELDHNLSEKKQELIDSISKKLQVLRDARETLLEDIQANNCLGDEVEAIVQEVCKPNEFDKFRMFIGDLDKVVNLLLSLSGRLARVENALNNLDENASPEERRTLVEKQKLLTRQHEDAKELKENLDRRERIVFDILASYLSDESLADYEHFVKMKSALIIEQRELEDKIKLGEEQLKCLTESLPFDRIK